MSNYYLSSIKTEFIKIKSGKSTFNEVNLIFSNLFNNYSLMDPQLPIITSALNSQTSDIIASLFILVYRIF